MSTDHRSRAWVEVSAAGVLDNLERIRRAMGSDARMIPMVKADGYGLGVERLVEVLEPTGPMAYGVAAVEEGAELRRLGVERTVMVFSPLPPDAYRAAVESGLTVCLSDLSGLAALEEAARAIGRTASFHAEVDTGMGRAGFAHRGVERWGPELARANASGLRWTGCYTHLHSADEADERPVETQVVRFREALRRLELPDDDFVIHVANSAGALRAPERLGGGRGEGDGADTAPSDAPRIDPVARPGIFLYGGRAGVGLPAPTPVASLKARVVLVRDAPPGTTVGYGATYEATSEERWATLAIGYGDGLPRALGNRGHALLKGRRVPVIGRVSMDVTVVNISDVPGVELGDVATLIGQEEGGEITVDEVAELSGTISYEILTGLTARLPRIWVHDDRA